MINSSTGFNLASQPCFFIAFLWAGFNSINMSKQKFDNYYDIAYKTKSGRMMVAKRIAAKTSKEAKEKLKKEMRASSSFDGIITAIKL